ncbi:MAG: maleylacetate reductase [Gemmatimonadaceae bacterium]|nr:maleylacetate reductase [Gemmatimonadaceae bacterium]
MTAFTWEGIQSRVIFGARSIEQIPTELERLRARRVMLVSTPGRTALADRAGGIAGNLVVARFDRAVVHVPEDVAAAARSAATTASADCVLAIGGGSAIGVAKAVALTSGLPIVAVPTTYSGSEMTPVWGVTSHGIKQTGRDARVQPRVVVYDPLLTMDLPANVAAMSGMNAMAHCVEALYAPDCNPLTSLAAAEGIRVLGDALPGVARSPAELAPRENALMGAWFAGTALGAVQMGLHHKLCHTLGGSLDLPHAETHAVMLPYTAAFNRDAAARAMRIAANSLRADDAPAALMTLASRVGAPRSLQEIGMREGDIDLTADLAFERKYPNPRPVTRADLRALLAAAFMGDKSYVVAAPSTAGSG